MGGDLVALLPTLGVAVTTTFAVADLFFRAEVVGKEREVF